jgi:hypothetical protein
MNKMDDEMARFLLGLLGLFGIFFTIGAGLYVGYKFVNWLFNSDCPYGYKNSTSNPYQMNDYSKMYTKPSSSYL